MHYINTNRRELVQVDLDDICNICKFFVNLLINNQPIIPHWDKLKAGCWLNDMFNTGWHPHTLKFTIFRC